MNWIIAAYLTYLAISMALTVWVARTLHTNGRIFLVDSFHGNEKLADSVNHLLVVGFYLINIGYVTLARARLHVVAPAAQTSRHSYEVGRGSLTSVSPDRATHESSASHKVPPYASGNGFSSLASKCQTNVPAR